MKLFIYFVLLFSTPILAQWEVIPEIPKTSPITNLFVDRNTVLASSDSIIYISKNNGESWMPSARIGEYVYYTNAVIKYGGRIFVGTETYGVYESSDEGKTWTQLNEGFFSLGSGSITKFEIRGDSLYAGTSGAGVFVRNLKKSGAWSHFSQGLYSNYSYTIYSLKNINGRLFTGAGYSGFLYTNEENSSVWNESKVNNLNSLGIYEFAAYEQNLFMTTSSGLFTSTDYGKTFSYVNHKVGAIMNSNIALNGSTLYLSYTKPQETFWFTSIDLGKTMNKIEDQLYVEVLSTVVIGNKLFVGRSDGLWYRDLINTSVDAGVVPVEFKLEQNYPNPFNPVTTIRYSIPGNVTAKLIVYNVLGREIITLVNEAKAPGNYSVKFDGTFLTSGIYFYVLNAGQTILTKKMLLLK